MTSSEIKTTDAQAQDVQMTDDELVVELVDGRTVSVPISWYPRLLHGSNEERNDWRLIGRGEGIHWTKLDEDIAIADLLEGRASAESQDSLRRWLKSRSEDVARVTEGR